LNTSNVAFGHVTINDPIENIHIQRGIIIIIIVCKNKYYIVEPINIFCELVDTPKTETLRIEGITQ